MSGLDILRRHHTPPHRHHHTQHATHNYNWMYRLKQWSNTHYLRDDRVSEMRNFLIPYWFSLTVFKYLDFEYLRNTCFSLFIPHHQHSTTFTCNGNSRSCVVQYRKVKLTFSLVRTVNTNVLTWERRGGLFLYRLMMQSGTETENDRRTAGAPFALSTLFAPNRESKILNDPSITFFIEKLKIVRTQVSDTALRGRHFTLTTALKSL